jgi:hypothetical protein
LILYIGDYDPSGMYMSEVDLPQRLARYSSNAPSEKAGLEWSLRALAELRLEIRRIALTEADTSMLGRPMRFPASDKRGNSKKKGDSRYDWFVRSHGHWCWELDALSPNVLRERLEKAIIEELDMEAWERYRRVEEAEREANTATRQAWASIPVPDHK